MAKKEKFEDKWVILAPHTKLREIAAPGTERMLDTGPAPLRVRLNVTGMWGGKHSEYEIALGPRGNHFGLSARWKFADPNPSYTIIDIPSVPREFTTLAVKGSEWEFERDWTFCGYDATNTMHTIPAGTVIKIADNKTPMCYFPHWTEKVLVVEHNPAFAKSFATGDYYKGASNKTCALPLREVAGYLKLKTAGKAKTYWRLEHTDGTPLVKKNFADLGKVKASARVRFNTVVNTQDDYDNGNAAPYWVEANDYADQPDIKRGLWAVQYDHATKKEIAREDLTTYIVMAKMKQPLTA